MIKLNFYKSKIIIQTIKVNNRNNTVIIPKIGEIVNIGGEKRTVNKVEYLYKTDEEYLEEINVDIYLS